MKKINIKTFLFYLIVIIFVILCCYYFKIRIDNAKKYSEVLIDEITVKDCLLYILGGIAKVKDVEDKNLKIPFIWFTLQLFILTTGYYAPFINNSIKDEWNLIKSTSRRQYIICQVRNAIVNVSIIYICVCIGVIIYTTYNGMNYCGVHYDYFLHICGVKVKKDIGLWILICPWIYGIFEVVMQLFLNIYVGRVLSIAFILSYNILCVYITSPFLLGNLSMLFRNSFIVERGCEITLGIIVAIVISIIAVYESIRKFNYMDIL